MPPRNDSDSSRAQYVDSLFTVGRKKSASAPRAVQPGKPSKTHPEESATSPIPLCEQSDLRAERDWLRDERKRLEGYLIKELAQLKQQRELLVAEQDKINEAEALRQHKLKRHMSILRSRAETVQSREKELNDRENSLGIKLEQVAK